MAGSDSRKLRSVDLFTGLGGFVLGLSHMYTPTAYCDSSDLVRTNLKRLIALGKLPKAPIVDDVRDTDAIVRATRMRRVDLITAGFPCTGFSVSGKHDGLSNAESGLVRFVFEAVDRLRPTAVMLENSSGVLTANDGKDMLYIVRGFERRGYDCRWTTCKASDVGLPQRRIRWFCLCTLREGSHAQTLVRLFRKHKANSAHGAGLPSATRAMPPLLERRSAAYPSRYFMLGNAVVPAVVRLAFERLIEMDLDGSAAKPRQGRSSSGGMPSAGFWRDGRAVPVPPAPDRGEPDHKILLCPDHYRPAVVTRRSVRTAEPITGVKREKLWPTPRAKMPGHSNVLTFRTKHDLATAALFACSVRGKRQAAPVQGTTVNPRFVEWLMGFPLGWTNVDVPDGFKPE